MSARRLAAAALIAATWGASAAELPSRSPKPKADAHTRICEIDGERGVALPGGGCVRIGGEVSFGATGVAVKH